MGRLKIDRSVAGRALLAAVLIFSLAVTGIELTRSSGRLDRLFQPFVQAEVGNERRFGGTGLGLAICRRIVAAMNGEIGVESCPGA